MNRSLERRIEELEDATGSRDTPIIVFVAPGDATDAAKARYLTEHPDTPQHAQFLFFVDGFSPSPDHSAEILS